MPKEAIHNSAHGILLYMGNKPSKYSIKRIEVTDFLVDMISRRLTASIFATTKIRGLYDRMRGGTDETLKCEYGEIFYLMGNENN